jgi:hypothetical protein
MGQAPTHPTEAMMIIQSLPQTGHANTGEENGTS